MTLSYPSNYWISANALYIERNALGNPDYIQASCVSGAQILVYIKDVIGYDAGHNYRRWSLQASPTVFNSHTEKYVYVALPRDANASTAQVVFPSELIDVYGKNEKEEQVGDERYYYVFLQGILSSSGDNGTTPREWATHIETGFLSSDEALAAGPTESEWYSYSTVHEEVTFLKNILMKAGTMFLSLCAHVLEIASGGRLSFADTPDRSVSGIAGDETPVDAPDRVATPAYVDNAALSKRHNDKTDFDIELKNLRANGTVDVFGNLTAHDAVTVGVYNKGVEGAHIDFYGNAEFESLVARTFFETPELRYNRTTITVGNKWQTQGAGIIEKVWAGDNADNADIKTELALTPLEGVAKLKLEDGEVGAIALNDKCQGVFHFTGKNNDTSTTDSKDGNFHFAGFTTIYFLVKEIYTAETLPASVRAKLADGESISENQFFRYELRAATCAGLPTEDRNRWTDASHPQPAMHFAAYANATNSDRQSSRLTTTTYQLHLAGMTGWTYTQENIRLIIGWLDGFSFLQRIWDKDKKEFVEATKELHGEGIATGNIYMWGTIDQFDRVPSLVSQQLYFRSSQSLAEKPDGIIIDATHTEVDRNGWQRDPITPSSTDRFVWQQWLYSYSDGTYTAGDVTFHAADPTALSVKLSQSIVSVAISDWYDTANPDDIEFEITAQVLSGETPIVIKEATAAYGVEGSATTLSYSTSFAHDSKSVTYRITLHGFVGVEVNGATPEDAFVTLSLGTDYGTANGVVTIAQNREGESGTDGVDAVSFAVSRTSIVARPSDKRQSFSVLVRGFRGAEPMTYNTDFLCSTLSDSSEIVPGLTWTFRVASNNTDFSFILRLDANASANADIPFTITDQKTNRTYQYLLTFATVTDGVPGLIARTSEWQAGAVYHNDEDLQGGLRYLDVVTVTATDGDFAIYQCRKTHTATNENKPSAATSEFWEPVNKLTTPIYTPLIIAENAVLRFGQTNRLLIMSTDGKKVQGCLTGVDDPSKPVAWFGGETAGTAKTTISYDGILSGVGCSFTNGTFAGSLVGVSGTFSKLSHVSNADAYISFDQTNGGLLLKGYTTIDGSMRVSGDILLEGELNVGVERTGGTWSQGSFGALHRVYARILDGLMRVYYYSVNNGLLFADKMLDTFVENGKTFYAVPCYVDQLHEGFTLVNDFGNGAPIDTFVFEGNSEANLEYSFKLFDTQKITVLHAVDKVKNKIFVRVCGKSVELAGGVALQLWRAPQGLASPAQTGAGHDVFVVSQYDNTWA